MPDFNNAAALDGRRFAHAVALLDPRPVRHGLGNRRLNTTPASLSAPANASRRGAMNHFTARVPDFPSVADLPAAGFTGDCASVEDRLFVRTPIGWLPFDWNDTIVWMASRHIAESNTDGGLTMNMQEAADRLAKIIKRLGGGTSTTDQAELEGLLADMKIAGGAPLPKPKAKKHGAKKTMAPTPPPAAEREKVTKAKATTTKATGK